MLIAFYCPSRVEELDGILKPMLQSISSYALHLDEVQIWARNNLEPPGWQRDLLQLCLQMLRPDRSHRPSALDLDLDWSSMVKSDEHLMCMCPNNTVPTNGERLAGACRDGSKEEVEGLLLEGVGPNTMGGIHFAAERGSVSIVSALLHAGARVDARNLVGQTALQCAARNGLQDVVLTLLQNKANVNASDENGRTALHGAAGLGHVDVVKLLLYNHANARAEDIDGCTASEFAARRHHTVIESFLRDHLQLNIEDGGSLRIRGVPSVSSIVTAVPID